MKWDKYTIDTTTEAEDFISMMLSENGIEGIEIEDNVPLTKEETGEMFIDFPPPLFPVPHTTSTRLHEISFSCITSIAESAARSIRTMDGTLKCSIVLVSHVFISREFTRYSIN